MNELEIIELLISQRESSINLWENLLTVSLAIIAFYGAMNSRVEDYINWVLLSLYCLFAASNFRALWQNFALREDIGSLLEDLNSMSPFLESLVPSYRRKILNFGFHIIVDLFVVILFLSMYFYSKDSHKVAGKPDDVSKDSS